MGACDVCLAARHRLSYECRRGVGPEWPRPKMAQIMTVIEKKAKLRMRRSANETYFGATSNNMLFVQVGQGDCQTIAESPRSQETRNRRNAVRTTMALRPLIADDVRSCT
eukprot:scaffold109454_cov46-Attheya_sp.AAC.1